MIKPQSIFPVTIFLCAILAIVYIAMVLNGISVSQPGVVDMLNWGAIFAPFVEKGEWWRLFSSSLIHFGIVHLVVNIISLWVLGRDFERQYGSGLFILVYFTGAFVTAIGSFYINMFTISAGASGAIMTIAGAQLAGLLFVNDFNRRYRIITFIHLFFAILLNVGLGFFILFIDNAAHITGILWGVVCGLLVFPGYIKSRFINATRLFSVMLLTVSLFFIFVFRIQPYRYWYFTMFNSFLSNDTQTVELLNSNAGPENPLISMAGIIQANEVWNKNLEMLQLFKDPPKKLQHDLIILKRIFELRQISLLQMKKYISTGDFSYVDSIQIQNEKIKNLPSLKYWLSFEEKNENKNDVSDSVKTFPAITWFDNTWKETTKDKAVYYRSGNKDDYGNTHGPVKDYYLSGQIQMKGSYVRNVENGLFFYYNVNGSYSAYGRFVLGNKTGEWVYFNERGIKIREVTYTENGELIRNSWDKNGVPGVFNGEGKLITYYDDGAPFELGNITKGVKQGKWTGRSEKGEVIFTEYYSNGNLINGQSIDSSGNKYLYNKIYEPPSIYGGEKELKKYLASELKYPDKAAKTALNDRVLVKLTIDKKAKLLNAEVFRKIGHGCDEEALRVIKNWNKFVAGKYRGQFETEDTYLLIEFPPQNNLKSY